MEIGGLGGEGKVLGREGEQKPTEGGGGEDQGWGEKGGHGHGSDGEDQSSNGDSQY